MTRSAWRWLLVPCLLLYFWLAVSSLVDDSPTMDEQNHLARGLAFLRTGDPRLSLEHPPLVNTLSALPLLTLDITLPTDDPSWSQREGWYAFADRLLWQVNADVTRMIVLARLPIVLLGMGLALVGYRFGRTIWHARAPGVMTAVLLLFDPNLLAHARYTTTDVGGTAFLLLATLALWQLWLADGWAWRRWAAAALALGLAFSSKLSILTFVPIWGVLALLPQPGAGPWRARTAARRLAQLLTAGALSVAVVWFVFGLQWGPFIFAGDQLAPLNRWQGPMPTFWAGIEQILFLSGGGRPAYLFGRFSDTGFPAYFPVALAVKTPLPLLALWATALLTLFAHHATRKTALFLTVPPALYLAVSTTSALNIGYRHLFPMLPFLALLAGGLLTARPPAVRRAAVAGALLLVGATLLVHPHYVNSFNLLGGGPARGYRILSDSNVDWGQDLLRLQAWMAANDVARIRLSYFGSAEPSYAGLAYDPLPGVPRHFDLWWNVPFDRTVPAPGLYAISAANLGEPPLRTEEKTVFAWFRAREPLARVGSIFIYEVP